VNEPQVTTIPADARPRLPRGVRLAHNEAQGGWVLLAPEPSLATNVDDLYLNCQLTLRLFRSALM
jgi:hypothetical protein